MTNRIAIYLTDTWRDEHTAAFVDYAQKFENLLSPHMPGTIFEHFDVVENEFPVNPTDYDGAIITGSSAFVTDSTPWIEKLFNHIHMLDAAKVKLFAVCFGHQAVAYALGGTVEYKEAVLGAPRLDVLEHKNWMKPAFDRPRIFAGNFQQVVDLPVSMNRIGSHPKCPNAMAMKGDHILGLQFHPELSAAYMRTYIDYATESIGETVANAALKEVEGGTDGKIVGQWAAAFLQGSN